MSSTYGPEDYGTDDDDVYVNDADETSKLLDTLPPGISSRTHSINGTQSVITESPDVHKSRWWSIRVMYLTMFLSSVSFSICMSSLYPYLKILDPTANTNFLGWVVAAYSVGQLVASPFFGAWSNCRAKTREPIVVSLIINILANILYMYLESINGHARLFLLLARALVGFGAGNVAVVRSYVAGATTLSERTSAMANMSAFQAIGFIIGPLIQTALVPVGYPGVVHTKALHLNMYTATAMFSAIVGVINVVLLLVVFKEYTIREDHFEPVHDQNDGGGDSYEYDNTDGRPDYFAVISSVILFFSVLFIFAVFETIATPLSMHMFAWKKAEATSYVGIMLGVAGVVSIGVFVVIKILTKRFNERKLLIGGFVFCLCGFIVYLPLGHQYPDIQFAYTTNPPISENLTTTEITPTKDSDVAWAMYKYSTSVADVGNNSGGFQNNTYLMDTNKFLLNMHKQAVLYNAYTRKARHSRAAHQRLYERYARLDHEPIGVLTSSKILGPYINSKERVLNHNGHDLKFGRRYQNSLINYNGRGINSNGRDINSLGRDIESDERVINSDVRDINSNVRDTNFNGRDINSSKRDINSNKRDINSDGRDINYDGRDINSNGHVLKSDVREKLSVIPSIHSDRVVTEHASASFLQSKSKGLQYLVKASRLKSTNSTNNDSVEAVGCPYYYAWCFTTPKIFLWQFFLGTFFVAVGYPTCNVLSYTIFSKILGPRPQGMWMGWLTAAGSLARTLGPIFVSQVYDAYGPLVTFIALIGLIFVTILGLLGVYKRLVPYKRAPRTVVVN